MGARVQGRDKKWVPGYTMYTRFLLGWRQSMVLHTHSFPLPSHFQLEQICIQLHIKYSWCVFTGIHVRTSTRAPSVNSLLGY